ncbi:class III lanthionine synthetase LanKC [Streptomyces sp. NPDC002537]
MLYQAHLTADPFFADSIEKIDDADTLFDRTRHRVPPGWRRAENGGWVYLHHDRARLPTQGWKVHVTSTEAAAAQVVDTVWEYCVERGICFKFRRSTQMLALVNGKQAARSASGKLVTVYPEADADLERVLEELGELLRGVEGPYILSDLRWGDGPLHLRYGGFSVTYCFGPDGAYVPAITGPDGLLVPDVRGTVFRVPPWVRAPAFVEERIRAARERTPGVFPYRVEKALHFSNSGGVYRAVEHGTGRTVVLREARPHAGVDPSGMDAVARLEHEHAMLRRLAGLGTVPAVLGLARHWEHLFLVEELIEGETLTEAVGRRHPLLGDTAGAGPARTDDYTRWALGVVDRIEEAVAALHARGVVFGDLQPSNVMVRPDGTVCLIDFETAFAVGEDFRPVFGTAGFFAPWARSGFAIDAYGLACLRLATFCPLTPLLHFDPDKAGQLVRWVADRFPVSEEFGKRILAEISPPAEDPRPSVPARTHPGREPGQADGDWLQDPASALDLLRDSILSTATPLRNDRLFPGDIRQFDHQGASLAFGAAGVLHALHTTGRSDYPEFDAHVDWLVRANRATEWPRPGLYDGLAGVALALQEFGRPEEARETFDRLNTFDLTSCGPTLFGGLTGIALAYLRLGDHERAVRLADRVAALLDDPAAPDPAKPGLMWGWSGPAYLFSRLAAATGEASYFRNARDALARDLAWCGVPEPRTVHMKSGEGWIIGPDRGSAGIGLALHAYLEQRPDAHFAGLLSRIRKSLEIELMLSPGLFDGHAGLLHCQARLGGPSRVRDTHLRALGRHAVRYQGRPAFGGGGLLRLSMDLATGTAGVMLAVHSAATAHTTGIPVRDDLPLLGSLR